MQKKFYLSALAILAAFGMTAKHVTPEEAMARATASGSAKAPAAVKMTCAKTFTTSNNVDALYIFKGGNNALVLPADDRIAPILGYFDGPTEGEMPEQLKWWLGEYVNQIEFLQSQPETSGSAAAPSYASSTETREAIAPMLTTKWNQSAPYNNQCPVDATTNETSVTGCVATAAAQVMNYYKYPTDALSGTIDYTDYGRDTTNGTARSLNIDGKKFDWANMLDRYTEGNYTDDQADAVAFLMAACGYASEMEYTSDESGTASIYFLQGAKKYFGYNQKAVGLNRDMIALDQWEDLLYKNLKTVGPLFYSGTDGSSGHAFVCDGYSDGYFHFNWGWGGYYDGFFRTTALKPAGTGIGGNSGCYSYSQLAIFNFTAPDAETISLPDLCPLCVNGNLYGIISGENLIITTDNVGTNTNSPIIYNISDQPVSGLLILQVVNTATNVVTNIKVSDSVTLETYNGMGYISAPTSYLFSSSGEYNISFKFQVEGSDELKDLSVDSNNSNSFSVTVDDNNNCTITNHSTDTPQLESASIPSVFYTDKPFRYTFNLKNNSNSYISDHIIPYLCTISTSSSARIVSLNSRKATSFSAKAIGEAVVVDIAPGETFSYTGNTQFSSYSNSSNSDLYFVLVSANTNTVIAASDSPVTVEDAPSTTTISANQFSLDSNSKESINPDLMKFSCNITCTEGYFADRVYVAILDESDNLVTYTASQELLIANANESDAGTIVVSFSDAEPETEYYAFLCSVDNNILTAVANADAIKFKTAKTITGLSAVNDGKGGTRIVADRSAGLVSVSAASDILSVQLYALDGRKLAPAVSLNGAAATIDMSQIPAGVSLVKVTLSDGSTAISKIVK